LDRDHYLDWVMTGLETSPQAKMPMAILITQIYWSDLLRSRKHGRRLAIALLTQLDNVSLELYYTHAALTNL
jgi:mediator of RNA polymerase II transcription subunit 12